MRDKRRTRTAVGNDIRTGGRCFENVPAAAGATVKNHRYAVVYRPGNFISAAKKAEPPSADGRRDCPTNRRYVGGSRRQCIGGALNVFGHRRQFDTSGKFRRIVRHTFPPAAANTSAIDLPAPAPGISGLSVGKGIFKPSPHIAVNGGINGNAGRFGAVFSAPAYFGSWAGRLMMTDIDGGMPETGVETSGLSVPLITRGHTAAAANASRLRRIAALLQAHLPDSRGRAPNSPVPGRPVNADDSRHFSTAGAL